jgi:hypothetical protein
MPEIPPPMMAMFKGPEGACGLKSISTSSGRGPFMTAIATWNAAT